MKRYVVLAVLAPWLAVVSTARAEVRVSVVATDPSTEVEYRIVEDTLRTSLAHLPDLHRRVLELRFGFTDGAPAAFSTISNVTGVAEAEVRELVTEALAMLAVDLRSVEDMRAA